LVAPYTWEMRSTSRTSSGNMIDAQFLGHELAWGVMQKAQEAPAGKREPVVRQFLEKGRLEASAKENWLKFERLRPVEKP